MPFSLDRVVPWGRSFEEYRRIFALTETDLKFRILGCADGPASFNAEATELGMEVVSVDPIYRFSRWDIESRIRVTFPEMMAQTRENDSEFVWKEFASVDELGRARMASMKRFLDDFDGGRKCGRYLPEELPLLPFEDKAFGLALCSHFLFLYTDLFSPAFHVDSIVEMCRVADEVRIFPLLSLGSSPSRHIIPVTDSLRRLGFRVKNERVEYEFQRGGNRMLRILQE